MQDNDTPRTLTAAEQEAAKKQAAKSTAEIESDAAQQLDDRARLDANKREAEADAKLAERAAPAKLPSKGQKVTYFEKKNGGDTVSHAAEIRRVYPATKGERIHCDLQWLTTGGQTLIATNVPQGDGVNEASCWLAVAPAPKK